MDTNESTPSTTVDNTSDAELTDEVNTLDNSELETETTEAETEEEGNTNQEQPKTEPEKITEPLIFGKYKTLEEAEKAYKESERAIKEKAELEKRLQTYHDQEEKARLDREIEAKQQGFSDVEAKQMDFEVKNFEFMRYAEALEIGYCGEDYELAKEALARYQSSLNPHDLAEAKKYFDPEAIEKIASNTALYRNQKSTEYCQSLQSKQVASVRGNLENFVKETADWLDVQERGAVIAEAVNLAGANVDLNKVRSLVDAIEAGAVKRFQEQQKVEMENTTQKAKLQSPTGNSVVNKETIKDWHDINDVDVMDQEVKKYFEEKNK